MESKIKKKILWSVVISALFITWLPYFNILNAPKMIMGLPQPLAITLACNVVLTLCVFVLYPLYFKPLIKKIDKKPLDNGGNK